MIGTADFRNSVQFVKFVGNTSLTDLGLSHIGTYTRRRLQYELHLLQSVYSIVRTVGAVQNVYEREARMKVTHWITIMVVEFLKFLCIIHIEPRRRDLNIIYVYILHTTSGLYFV